MGVEFSRESIEIFGVTLVGVNSTTLVKLAFSILLIGVVLLVRRIVIALGDRVLPGASRRGRFWKRQTILLITTIILAIGLVSIWATPGTDLGVMIGLITAGLAFALQKVITSLAAYFVILRGATFSVGDRITMGGVRGDVVRLGFLRTTVMEMGQPPTARGSTGESWVHSRQYTGRIVTVANSAIFDQPVFNYTREFPYLWEEISIPLPHDADRETVARVLREAASRHAVTDPGDVQRSLLRMRGRFLLEDTSTEPTVYCRIGADCLEMAVRFVTPIRGVRAITSAITSDVLDGLTEEGIQLLIVGPGG